MLSQEFIHRAPAFSNRQDFFGDRPVYFWDPDHNQQLKLITFDVLTQINLNPNFAIMHQIPSCLFGLNRRI